jgi:uncharacterized surface protein with fasciclin (FAS1) repeats
MKLLSKSMMIAAVVVMLGVSLFAALPAAKAAPSEPSIVEVALSVNAQTGEFSTLIAAVVAADLVDTLNGNRQFTVFAPTDAAFAELGLNAGNIGTLPTKQLTTILRYHIAPGERLSTDVVNASRIRMLNKGFTFVTVNSEGVFINDAKILAVDVQARNGVIHVIDGVLLP